MSLYDNLTSELARLEAEEEEARRLAAEKAAMEALHKDLSNLQSELGQSVTITPHQIFGETYFEAGDLLFTSRYGTCSIVVLVSGRYPEDDSYLEVLDTCDVNAAAAKVKGLCEYGNDVTIKAADIVREL